MSRSDQIAAMREMEMSDEKIAKELGITLSEVDGGPPVYPTVPKPTRASKKRAPRKRGRRTRSTVKTVGTWTRESIIEAIQRWAREHDGVPPRAKDWRAASDTYPHTATVTSGIYFSKWSDAIEAAGFPRPSIGIYQGNTSWNKEKVIGAIQTWAKEHNGKPPTYSDWKRGGGIEYPAPNTVTRYCGSWANAIEAAGFSRPSIGAHQADSKPPAASEPVKTLPDPEPQRPLEQEDVTVLKEAGLDSLADSAQKLLDEGKGKLRWPWRKR